MKNNIKIYIFGFVLFLLGVFVVFYVNNLQNELMSEFNKNLENIETIKKQDKIIKQQKELIKKINDSNKNNKCLTGSGFKKDIGLLEGLTENEALLDNNFLLNIKSWKIIENGQGNYSNNLIDREGFKDIEKNIANFNKIGEKLKVSPRLIASVCFSEKLRQTNSYRKEISDKLGKLGIKDIISKLGLHNFSEGLCSIKPVVAQKVEKYLKDSSSEFYLGEKYSNILDYKNSEKSIEELVKKRLQDDYYNILYAGLIIKMFETQWDKAGFNIDNKPGIIGTLYNLGFYLSKPNVSPKIGGAYIRLEYIDEDGKKKSKKTFFGYIAKSFFNSNLYPKIKKTYSLSNKVSNIEIKTIKVVKNGNIKGKGYLDLKIEAPKNLSKEKSTIDVYFSNNLVYGLENNYNLLKGKKGIYYRTSELLNLLYIKKISKIFKNSFIDDYSVIKINKADFEKEINNYNFSNDDFNGSNTIGLLYNLEILNTKFSYHIKYDKLIEYINKNYKNIKNDLYKYKYLDFLKRNKYKYSLKEYEELNKKDLYVGNDIFKKLDAIETKLKNNMDKFSIESNLLKFANIEFVNKYDGFIDNKYIYLLYRHILINGRNNYNHFGFGIGDINKTDTYKIGSSFDNTISFNYKYSDINDIDLRVGNLKGNNLIITLVLNGVLEDKKGE